MEWSLSIVNIFKPHHLRSHWANWSQMLCGASLSFFWPLSKVTQISTVSHLLWNYWANWSQIWYGASIDWRNKDSFRQQWLHDQDGCHAFKNLLWNQLANVVETWYTTLGIWILLNFLKCCPYVDPCPLYAKVNFGVLCICMGKCLIKWWITQKLKVLLYTIITIY